MKKLIFLFFIVFVNGMFMLLSFYYGSTATRFYPCSELYNVQFVAHGRYAIDTLADNSIELYEVLIKDLKYKIIETDILFTKDSIPVLCHEYNISQVAKNEKGISVNKNVDELQFSELRDLYFTKPETVNYLNGGGRISQL